jgi:hypothetical protein
MIKTLSAIAIAAVIAAAFLILPGFAPEVEAEAQVAAQKSTRPAIDSVDPGCSGQTWPNFSASCLHGNGAKLETRFVGADSG